MSPARVLHMTTAESTGVVDEVVDPVDPVDPVEVVDPADPPADPEDGEIEITLGTAAAPAAEEDDSEAPEWARNLRKVNREQARLIKELERKAVPAAADSAVPKLGPRPTMADHDYDEEAYGAALDKWYADKKSVDDHEAEQRRKVEDTQREVDRLNDSYRDASTKLRVPDFKAAEDAVKDGLTDAQRGIILHGADDPAKLVYVLGKYPEELKKLASIANPVKFAFAVAKLERDVKVTPRKDKPAPESVVGGGSASKAGSNAQLERLRAEAEKTGDYSKVVAFKAAQRAKK